MYRFAITLVAGSAAVVLFGLSALWAAATGVPYFIDSEIPTAVFLGLHLLVTDPSTSPRTPLGKTIFGVLYGVGVFVLYSLLGAFGAPTFYDKLLSVPLLNLSVRWIDRLAGTLETAVRLLDASPGAWPTPSANLAQMAVWIAFFAVMTLIGGDRRTSPGRHRAVLEAGVRGETAAGVRAAAADRGLVLRRRVGLGLQRAGTPLHRRQ